MARRLNSSGQRVDQGGVPWRLIPLVLILGKSVFHIVELSVHARADGCAELDAALL